MNLLDGYKNFKNNKLDEIKDDLKLFENGQKPHTLFITCSDSRIDPALITNSKPGEIFVIRNAGNFVANDSNNSKEQSVISTVEYALNILGIKNVVVCGHTDCGAVKAATADLSSTSYLKEYIPNFKSDHDCELDTAIEENVQKQIVNIKENVNFNKEIKYFGWVYNVSTGGLKVLNDANGKFEEIS